MSVNVKSYFIALFYLLYFQYNFSHFLLIQVYANLFVSLKLLLYCENNYEVNNNVKYIYFRLSFIFALWEVNYDTILRGWLQVSLVLVRKHFQLFPIFRKYEV